MKPAHCIAAPAAPFAEQRIPLGNRRESMMHERRAVVLLSGGLDSTTTLAIAKSQGFQIYALTFRYGQRHEKEIEAAPPAPSLSKAK
jgi:tRNA(Ile)-lysidine synthase TilS/MesJ